MSIITGIIRYGRVIPGGRGAVSVFRIFRIKNGYVLYGVYTPYSVHTYHFFV